MSDYYEMEWILDTSLSDNAYVTDCRMILPHYNMKKLVAAVAHTCVPVSSAPIGSALHP